MFKRKGNFRRREWLRVFGFGLFGRFLLFVDLGCFEVVCFLFFGFWWFFLELFRSCLGFVGF